MGAVAGSRPERGAICFVTADFDGSSGDGGIGSHLLRTSVLLAQHGWEVHCLSCGAGEGEPTFSSGTVDGKGISLHALESLPSAPGATIPHYGGDDPIMVAGEHVLEALRALHSEYRFDLIEFPDRGGLGLRSVQSKLARDGLVDVPLAVRLHEAREWQRECNLEQRSAPRELKSEFCERHAFERADVQFSPSRYMLDWARRADWEIRDDAAVATPYPEPEPEPTAQLSEIGELVFIGRLERARGLFLFLDALDSVDPDMPVGFFGADTLMGGVRASELIEERLGSRPHRIETGLDRAGVLTELRRGDRLAVIPSFSESFGFAVAECVVNRIPFIAAGTGGIPEVVDHPEARERWLFEPTAEGLGDVLASRLSRSGTGEIGLREEVAVACDPGPWNDRVEAVYRRAAQSPPKPATVRVSEPPTVTVAVCHFNHPRFLPSALASLAEQTRPPEEVIVVDDDSTSEAARRVFDEQQARFPKWNFVRRENVGPGAERNYCLERATGTYFLPFDSDNIATPGLIERLVNAMEANPSRAATTCHNLGFVEDADIDAGEFAFRYSPTGGPRLAACIENVYGDTCAMFRAEMLRSVGGFEDHRWSPYEDWETFVKMSLAGLDVGVLPQPLFYYRTNVGGRMAALTSSPAVDFRHRVHLIKEFFADAELTIRERRELWECLPAFDHFATRVAGRLLQEEQQWHEDQMEDLRSFASRQLDEVRGLLEGEVEAQHSRAEAAEAELASLSALTPRRLLRRGLRAARTGVSKSSRRES